MQQQGRQVRQHLRRAQLFQLWQGPLVQAAANQAQFARHSDAAGVAVVITQRWWCGHAAVLLDPGKKQLPALRRCVESCMYRPAWQAEAREVADMAAAVAVSQEAEGSHDCTRAQER